MAKTPMRCPFNNKLCVECHLYRGRHYFLCNCKNYRGYIKPKNNITTDGKTKSVDLEKIKGLLEPWSIAPNIVSENAYDAKIKLKVVDLESGKERYCEPTEVKTWKWADPTIMRVVSGTHVNSWAKLIEMMQYYEEKGAAELIIYEAPSFMMIAGG